MKTIFLLLTLTLIFCNSIFTQVQQEWVARYNGPPGNSGNVDEAYLIAVDGSGNVYVTGMSAGYGWDYATIKYNSSGVQQWVQRYNGLITYGDVPRGIDLDNAGNVYVTGNSSSNGNEIATIKYNSSGIEQWVQRYRRPGIGSDEAYSIAVDNAGNVYITGKSNRNWIASDYLTIKYNSSGIEQWTQMYNGPGNLYDEAYSIALDNAGNVYVTGDSYGNGTNYDYATIKYNSLGIQQWVQRYNGQGSSNDYANSMVIDNSGNIYVTGASYGNGTNSDYATLKYNSSGVEQWFQRYNGQGNGSDESRSISVDNSGNVYVTGLSWGSGSNYDYATVKYKTSGVEQWVQRYNGSGNYCDIAHSIAIDNSGNVYVAGLSYGSGTNYDYATIKYNTSGVEQWLQIYNVPGNGSDYAYSIAIDNSGNVYVTGASGGIGTSHDYATIKYSQLIGIQPISNEIPNDFSLSQNFPNPFNPNTIIRFKIKDSRLTILKVFDLLGREVATLVNEQLQPGTYEVDWDAANYPSGVYYYKLIAGDYSETKKMVVLK